MVEAKQEPTSTTVKIAKTMIEAIDQFLESEEAKRLGYRFKSDIVNEAIREFFKTHNLEEYLDEQTRFQHFNIYDDHVTMWDKVEKLLDVYFRNSRPYCTHHEQHECEHITFALSIPKVREALKQKG